MEHMPDPEPLKDDVYAEAFPQIIGVNPFLELIRGKAEAIPQKGWMIRAEILPVNEGGAHVTIYKYSKGDFKVSFFDGRAEKGPAARVHCTLRGGFYSVSYDAPSPYVAQRRELLARSGSNELEAHRGIDSIALENGGLLTRPSRRMVAYDDGVFFSFSKLCVLSDGLAVEGEWVHIDRAVPGIEEVGAVLVNLGALMGLEQNDTHTLVTSVAQKIGHLA